MDADMTIRDVMSREFVGASESDPVDSTVDLMFEEGADCVVVLRGGDPVGMLTERDVLASIAAGEAIETATVAEVMGEAVPSVRSDRDLAVGIDRLAAADVSQLVVTENGSGEPVGLLTHRDVATTIAHSLRSNRSSYGANGTDARSGRFEGTNRRANDGDTIQGICESCGTLSDSLASVDGQLLCGNCRDV